MNFTFWEQFPLIQKQLTQVNDCILKTIKTPHTSLQTALQTMANNGGKYLRPALLLLSAQASGDQQAAKSVKIIRLAAAIEILHMATLIHDDIIDDSDKRRGRISIQARFGKDTAVYAGDLLFTNFFHLMLKATSEHHYLIINANTMNKILNGELGQMAERFDLKQTLNNYLANVKGKTAALFRLASMEGAHFAGADPEKTTALANFGENIGIAFQMVDDILDYTGQNLNKPVLEDLTTGVYSLPLLLALRKEKLRSQLKPLLDKKLNMSLADIKQIQTIILQNNLIAESRDLADSYSNKAIKDLEPLPNNPATHLLRKLPKLMLNRSI